MSKCVQTVDYPKIKFEENKRKIVFDNPLRLPHTIGEIDDCLITEGIRPDNFIANDSTAVLVELKGCDIKHACAQLFEAATHPKVSPYIKGKKLGFLIVCARFPKDGTAVQVAKSKALRTHKAKFKVVCDQRELRISDWE